MVFSLIYAANSSSDNCKPLNTPDALHTSSLQSFEKIYSGKVRDVYAVEDTHLLIIATDRISAFDVILPGVIPGKGKLLTRLALFWFEQMSSVVPNHLSDLKLEDLLTDANELAIAAGRSMIVKRLDALPVEAVVRGYLIGSGWADYQATGSVCGITLPDDLPLAGELETPIFTPATKAAAGDHDENISYPEMQSLIGDSTADAIREISLTIYRRARDFAKERNIIIADTKFEFGLDEAGRLTLMDEILTPDSSRFWPADGWQPGENPNSLDKQFVRDYLETLDWNKTAPGPSLPQPVVDATLTRYQQAIDTLTQ